jgi:hypothetical protein
MTAGYSGTPLVKKLGIKPGMAIYLRGAPPDYADTLGPLPDGVEVVDALRPGLDFIHIFTDSRQELEAAFADVKAALAFDGMLWVSWPKKASKVPTDLSDGVVREVGLSGGLVDVKVAAVDVVWSGLKFVYRVEDRPR